jgi:uncharacterized membrane protein HdeD (DUF308 family)
MVPARPKGVTVIGIFDIIQSPLVILLGIGWNDYLYAIVFVALGITSICVGIGLLKGKEWAWKIAVILSLIGIATGLIPLLTPHSPITLILGLQQCVIDVAILYYLFRPHVKAYFGKNISPAVT